MVECVWNVMANAQKPHFVFRRKGRVHLNRRGRQFSRILAAEVCASAVVMLDTACSEVAWRVVDTHSIRQFPFYFPLRASPCAITFRLDSTQTLTTVFTRIRPQSRSWIRYSPSNHPVSLWSFLILSFHPQPGLPSSSLFHAFPSNPCMNLFLPHEYHELLRYHLPWFEHRNIFGEISIRNISPVSFCFPPVRSKYLPHEPVQKTPESIFLL